MYIQAMSECAYTIHIMSTMCVLEGIFCDNPWCLCSLGNFPGIGLLLLNLWVLVLEAKDCCEHFIKMQVLACSRRGTVSVPYGSHLVYIRKLRVILIVLPGFHTDA